MEYNTKFSIGEEVWYMHCNKVHKGIVTKIRFIRFLSPVDYKVEESESYYLEGMNSSFEPKAFYRSKEELIDSLR